MRILTIMGLALVALAGCGTQGPTPPPPPDFDHRPPPDDPGPGQGGGGMEVEGLLGRLSDYAIQEAIQAQMAGFNNCFQRAGGAFVNGEVQLSFLVGVDGRVREVFVSESSLGSWSIEDCLVQTARFLEFPPPEGGPARFIFPFLWNDAARRLTRQMDAAWGYETVRGNRKLVRECRATHKVEGSFHITVYVGARGRVLDAGFHSAKPTGDRFPACIVEAVRSMTFPDPGAATYKYALLVEDLPDT
ncbi:MAG: AgmX/PglI C-terminal domain-containing protein [Myxococcales bacterium]|nr:AgmX/PglI C-terminal domain-containing protein [Myxococcales bacterium]